MLKLQQLRPLPVVISGGGGKHSVALFDHTTHSTMQACVNGLPS